MSINRSEDRTQHFRGSILDVREGVVEADISEGSKKHKIGSFHAAWTKEKRGTTRLAAHQLCKVWQQRWQEVEGCFL